MNSSAARFYTYEERFYTKSSNKPVDDLINTYEILGYMIIMLTRSPKELKNSLTSEKERDFNGNNFMLSNPNPG